MPIIPTEKKKQIQLFVAIVFVAAVAAYQQLMWSPQQDTLNKMNARADTLDSLNRIAKQEMASGNAAKMRAEADGFGKQLTTMRRLVPTASEVPALIDGVSNAARAAGLDLSELSPDGRLEGQTFDIYRYKVSVTGSYNRIATFLTNIGTLERIVEPINVSLLPSTKKMDVPKNQSVLDAHLDIQTYVARTTPLPPPLKAAK